MRVPPSNPATPPSIFLLSAIVVGFIACPADKKSSPPLTGARVQVVETTGDRSKLLEAQPEVKFSSGGTQNSVVINLDSGTHYQEFDGVGGSLTDSAAWVIWNKLDASQRISLMDDLFSPSKGIGISFLRQPMGASDFAVNGNYSYNDVPDGQTDPGLTSFSIAHDSAYIIPLIKQAMTINPAIKVVGVPWSPPAWMKTNGSMNAGAPITSYFPSLAQYFVKFTQAYAEQGIPIYALSVQNEPMYATQNYPSQLFSAAEEADFIANHLGPALDNSGLRAVKLLAYDHNWDNTAYADTILTSPSAPYVAGTAFHCYKGDVAAQSVVKTAHPDKDIWFTECSGTVGSSFAGDLVWNSQHLLIGATRNWARSVSLWNLALDQNSGPTNGGCPNCRGVVTIDDRTSPPTITRNVEYYVLGHLGKFVVPGAHRIATNTTGPGPIEQVAFQNPDGSVALLVLNSGAGAASFTVNWKTTSFNYTLPAQSIATFLWK